MECNIPAQSGKGAKAQSGVECESVARSGAKRQGVAWR